MSRDVEIWLGWSRELHSIAQAGLTYAENAFDVQRYRRLREIAADLAAALSDGPPDPVRMALVGETGYLTPKLDVRAAVVDDDGRVLLVREAADGRWALPGGWADVNEGLISGAVREVREESGYRVEATRLLGIYDKRSWGAPPSPLFTLTSVVACRLLGGEATPSVETTQVGWFRRDALPELSTGRTPIPLLARVFAHHDDPTLPQDLS
ncbi:MAG TPA: NUDIX hydrolase N-terminal domain-containing protein [Kineosporiaceae bacterium]